VKIQMMSLRGFPEVYGRLNVRFGSKADIFDVRFFLNDVRFTPKVANSGHGA
jgi:hypothetical protein